MCPWYPQDASLAIVPIILTLPFPDALTDNNFLNCNNAENIVKIICSNADDNYIILIWKREKL